MATKQGHPTLADVAALAGVSVKTASRVLNGEPNVRPEKVERVTAAVDELGWRRNEMARLLRTRGAAPMVGVIAGAVSDPFWAGVIGGLEADLGDGRYVLSATTEEDASREQDAAMAMVERRVMALVIVPVAEDQSYLQGAIRRGTPVISVDRPARGIEVDTVIADDRRGAMRATELLIEVGHRRIAFVARSSRYTTGERLRGFRKAMAEAGLETDEDLIDTTANSEAAIDATTERLVNLTRPPTAIFTANVAVTVQTLITSRRLGWHPGIVAFSDFASSRALSPSITVVDNTPSVLGRCAAELVKRRVDGDTSPPERIQIETPLIVRQSHLQFP